MSIKGQYEAVGDALEIAIGALLEHGDYETVKKIKNKLSEANGEQKESE